MRSDAREQGVRRVRDGAPDPPAPDRLRHCGDWDRADDLLQTALIKLYVAWPRLSGAAPRRRTSAGSSSARPIDERLPAGRRALRRRRIVATGATAAAVAALVLTPLAAGRLHGSPEQSR